MARELVQNKAKVTCDSLKVREEASLDAEVIMTVAKEERLDVLEVLEEWVKVEIDGQELYVSGEYVEITEEAKDYITEHGYDPVYGARPLKRYVQKHVETLAAKIILRGDVVSGNTIVITKGEEGLSAEIR